MTIADARRLADAGQSRQAASLCDALLRANPGCVETRLLAAACRLAVAQPGEALDHLDAAAWYLQAKLRHDPSSGLAGNPHIEQLLLRGKALMQLQRPDDAITVWRQITRVAPRHPAALRLIAAALEQLGRHDQAIACLEHLLLTMRTGPARFDDAAHDIADLQHLADLCERDHQPARAITLLERYRLADEPAMQIRMVRLLRQADRKHEALDRLTRLCGQHPDDLSLAMLAAELAGQLGHEQIMVRHAHRLPAADPARAAALAAHHHRCGRFAQAGRLWWRLTRQSPSDAPRALACLAVCATLLGRDRLAARAARLLHHAADAAQRQAHLADAWLAATPGRLILQQQGDELQGLEQPSVLAMLLHEACSTLEQKAELRPGYADLHHHLAVCHRHLGRRDHAAINSERALRINGGYTQAALCRAEMLLEDGTPEAALAVLNAALARKPAHIELHALAGAIEVMSARRPHAVARLASSVDKPLLRQRIAHWLDRLGRDGEARQWRNAA
ncbi:MAG: tetratricopeptide repeat protein [Phycisphaerales bacterium]